VRAAVAALLALVCLALGATTAHAAGCGATTPPTRTIYLPNITKTLGGASGWVTPFIVQNVGVAPTDLEVSFYRFSDGALVTCRRVAALQPYRSFADVPNNDVDLPGDSQFGVVVRSFGADVIAVVNEHQGAGPTAEALSYVGLSSGAQTLALPYVAKFASGWLVTFVVQNLGTANANVTARFVSYDGAQTATITRTIAPGASRFVNPVAEPTLTAGTEYSVVLTSDQPIAAIANAHNDAPGAPAPMGFSYNAVNAGPGGLMYVPSVPRNADGRTGRVIVQNSGGSDASPTLLFQRQGTAPVTVNAPAVRAGRAWSFDPRRFADGVTACPATGAANCVGEGDWSLTVSGGPFAVLVTSANATSALGFVGTSAPGNRAYLPNVTRTLGGASSWTTPIVLQSAGATAASLRWYRFADGALVTRQTVTGLTNGLAARVDPRTVPGLSDDTQYAVVVDAQGGNIVATVLELSFLGGDGAMAYEGFKASVSTTPLPAMIVASAPKTAVFTGARVGITAVVKDQFDNPLNLPLAWSVSPSNLGQVSTTGTFSASETATGVANITASAGGASATVAITISERPTTTVGGIAFAIDATGRADVYTEKTITGSDASTVATQIDLDVLGVQSDYGRPFASRARLYVVATTASYSTALQKIFGYDAALAEQLATTSAGIYGPSEDAVAINWSAVEGIEPLSIARHELTHRMEHQVAGAAFLPAWFNEGQARLAEFTTPNSQYLAMNARYATASMAHTGTLFALAELTSQFVWNRRSFPASEFQYYASAEAVRQIRDRVGSAGVIRILELMSEGVTFETAFAQIAGETYDAFAAAYPTRMRALAPSYPGIATAPDSAIGTGLALMFYGFPPNSIITYSVSGPGGSNTLSGAVTSYGTLKTYLANSWPPGTYAITATWAGGTVTTTAVKPASFGPLP